MFGLLDRRWAARLHASIYASILALGFFGLVSLLMSGSVPALPTAVTALSEPPAQLQALTAGAGLDGFGAFSPDGKRIAFMRNGQILLIGADGGSVAQLTTGGAAWDAAPVWRPDGKELAFVRISRETGRANVMAADARGGGLRSVAAERSPIGYIAWMPDGKSLLYSTTTHIHRVDVATGRQIALVAAPEGEELLSGGLAVARDGARLVFGKAVRTQRGALYDLYSVPLSGGTPTRLTEEGGLMPTISPDGRSVVFRNPRRPGAGIYQLDFGSNQIANLLTDEAKAMYFHPSFSPDGKQLVISRLTIQGGQGPGAKINSQLYLHRLGR